MQNRFAILALDASGKIMSRVILRAEPGKQPLQGIKTVAGNMLRLKGCVRTEIRAMENDASMSTCSPVKVLL